MGKFRKSMVGGGRRLTLPLSMFNSSRWLTKGINEIGALPHKAATKLI